MGLVINLIVVAAFVLFFVLLIYFYKRNKPIILNQIKQRFESEGILSLCEDSYFVGLASSSPAPAGGYGVWVLTSKRVYSRAYVGPFELDLPFERILEVKAAEKLQVAKGISYHYHGKEGKMLIVMRFMTEDNQEDSTAWYVSGLEEKMELLRQKVLVT